MMNKKILAVAVCLFMGGSLAACGGPGVQKDPGSQSLQDTQEVQENMFASEEGIQESQKSQTMTDEELLAALGDNINVVTDDAYAETVKAFLESTDDYAGKIYQLSGAFVKEGETPYLTSNTGEDAEIRIPLKCLVEEPQTGSKVRVTGIVNYGDVDGESVPVLDVAVIETLAE